jgi:hypothetical protein
MLPFPHYCGPNIEVISLDVCGVALASAQRFPTSLDHSTSPRVTRYVFSLNYPRSRLDHSCATLRLRNGFKQPAGLAPVTFTNLRFI